MLPRRRSFTADCAKERRKWIASCLLILSRGRLSPTTLVRRFSFLSGERDEQKKIRKKHVPSQLFRKIINYLHIRVRSSLARALVRVALALQMCTLTDISNFERVCTFFQHEKGGRKRKRANTQWTRPRDNGRPGTRALVHSYVGARTYACELVHARTHSVKNESIKRAVSTRVYARIGELASLQQGRTGRARPVPSGCGPWKYTSFNRGADVSFQKPTVLRRTQKRKYGCSVDRFSHAIK